MPRDIRGEVDEVFADTGDVADPIVVDFRKGYELSFEQTNGKKPTREGFNKIFQQLYSMGRDVSQYGAALPYSQTINFLVDAIVTHNGELFMCIQANGPLSSVRIPGTGAGAAFWDDLRPETEQTFTPRLSDEGVGGNLATIGNAKGWSSRIGDNVNISVRLRDIDVSGMIQGNPIRLQNLPVPIDRDFGASVGICVEHINFTHYVVSATSSSSNTVLAFKHINPGAATTFILVSDIVSVNANMIFSVSYRAA